MVNKLTIHSTLISVIICLAASSIFVVIILMISMRLNINNRALRFLGSISLELYLIHGLPIPPYVIYNIGNNQPKNLLDFVNILQQELVRAKVLPADYNFDSHKKLVPMQPGDVAVTYADIAALEEDFGFKPATSLREGLKRFAEWYKEFYL